MVLLVDGLVQRSQGLVADNIPQKQVADAAAVAPRAAADLAEGQALPRAADQYVVAGEAVEVESLQIHKESGLPSYSYQQIGHIDSQIGLQKIDWKAVVAGEVVKQMALAFDWIVMQVACPLTLRAACCSPIAAVEG